MLVQEENERLTRVGPGTPMGELLRRYWHPIATEPDLERERVLKVRILGEDLVLYKTNNEECGLIQERCPHRSASLAYGIPDEEGIRCPYHGWYFNGQGACLEQPFEDVANPETRFKDKIRVAAYPVETLGGLVFAYMGPPEKKPLLPRWEPLVKKGPKTIGVTYLPCNWLQVMENSLDPVHVEWLHSHFMNYVYKRQGKPPPVVAPQKHEKIAFDVFEYGIYKRRLYMGVDPATSPDWLIGHPMLFPNMLGFGQIRVPIDDYNTLHFTYDAGKDVGENYKYYTFDIAEANSAKLASPDADPDSDTITVRDIPWKHEDGRLVVETVIGDDMMAWITQGPIAPRDLEHLGVSDRGIILYRSILRDATEAVARGEDPPGIVRDPAKNQVISWKTEYDLPGGRRRLFQQEKKEGAGFLLPSDAEFSERRQAVSALPSQQKPPS